MANHLKDSIKTSKLLLISEERIKKLEYKDLNRKGGKVLSKGDENVTRVEVAISNISVPGMASIVSSFAAKYKKFNEAKKEFEQLRSESRGKFAELFSKFFDPEDELLSRVIKTAGYCVTLSRASTRKNFDKEKFISLLKENFKDANKVIDDLVKQCESTTSVAGSIDIEVNESDINENKITDFIKNAFSKLKNSISVMLKSIKSIFSKMDSRLNILDSMIDDSQQSLYKRFILNFKSLVTESVEIDDQLDDITEDKQSFMEIGLLLKNALEDTHHKYKLSLNLDKPQDGEFILSDGDYNTFRIQISEVKHIG